MAEDEVSQNAFPVQMIWLSQYQKSSTSGIVTLCLRSTHSVQPLPSSAKQQRGKHEAIQSLGSAAIPSQR